MKLFFAIVLLLSLVLASAGAFGHGVSDADRAAMLASGNLGYLKLGAKHMLTGNDHLLFLFAVMFFLTKVRDIVALVTAFTLGHSITLLLATLLGITMNSYLVDAVIALTVCYKGFDNLDGFRRYFGMAPPPILPMVFVFGLIHGFGLSTRLQQLPLPTEGLILRILSFNVGVEAGQVVALIGMLFVLSTWRQTTSFVRFSAASNTGLVAAGLLLLLVQLHAFSHQEWPSEFGFNHDAHHHAHEAIQRASK